MAKSIFEVQDKDGVLVSLAASRWHMHIAEKHAEVEPFLEQIQEVIKSPQIVTQDIGGAYHLSRVGAVGGKWQQLYLEVVIQYEESSDSKLGHVLTVHFNAGSPKGELKWISLNS